MGESPGQMDTIRSAEQRAEQLCNLLEQQLAAAREGDASRVESLGASVDAVIGGAGEPGAGLPVDLGRRRERVKRLYDELRLVLSAEQADIQGRLKQLRKVRKALSAYRGGFHYDPAGIPTSCAALRGMVGRFVEG